MSANVGPMDNTGENIPTMAGTASADALRFRLDRIARRQQARFLDRQRAFSRLTPEMEAEIGRLIRFILDDVRTAIREHLQGNDRARPV